MNEKIYRQQRIVAGEYWVLLSAVGLPSAMVIGVLSCRFIFLCWPDQNVFRLVSLLGRFLDGPFRVAVDATAIDSKQHEPKEHEQKHRPVLDLLISI